jgi:hypothetical protein
LALSVSRLQIEVCCALVETIRDNRDQSLGIAVTQIMAEYEQRGVNVIVAGGARSRGDLKVIPRSPNR